MSRFKDLTGLRFGNLYVVKYLHKSKDYRDVYECICDCTRTVKLVGKNLTSGNSTKCRYCKYFFQRKEKSQAGFNRLWLNYVHGAKRRNLEFLLNKDEFKVITQKNCFYCGIKPSSKSLPSIKTKYKNTESFNHSVYIYNGIDRINTNKGYNIDNCVACCEMCNKAKLDNSLEIFLDWISRISKYQFGENNG